MSKSLPSARWTSYDGMEESLKKFVKSINKSALVEHAKLITGKPISISEAFSAGQHWLSFELVADSYILIAQVRLPRVDDENEMYAIESEVATMKFLHKKLASVSIPEVFANESAGSQKATKVGAPYMLIEGFYGNTLEEICPNILELPTSTLEHIITQWTAVQAELASFTFPGIGLISHLSNNDYAVISNVEESINYFAAIGKATYEKACQYNESDDIFLMLGPFIFQDIVRNTDLFKSPSHDGRFHINHMDLGPHNILVDSYYNFLAITDWKSAQTAPWEVNEYPMLFALPFGEIAPIAECPELSCYVTARRLYRQKFRDAEQALEKRGKPLQRSIADTLEGGASRIYAVLSFFDPDPVPGMNKNLTYEMVRLAFGFKGEDAEQYIQKMYANMEVKNLQSRYMRLST